jgi:hypothetical protein
MIIQNMLANPHDTCEDALQLCELHTEQVFNHHTTNRQSHNMISTANGVQQYPCACAYLSSQGKKLDYYVGDGLWAILDSHLRNRLTSLRRDRIKSLKDSPSPPTPSKYNTEISFATDKPTTSSSSLPQQ